MERPPTYPFLDTLVVRADWAQDPSSDSKVAKDQRVRTAIAEQFAELAALPEFQLLLSETIGGGIPRQPVRYRMFRDKILLSNDGGHTYHSLQEVISRSGGSNEQLLEHVHRLLGGMFDTARSVYQAGTVVASHAAMVSQHVSPRVTPIREMKQGPVEDTRIGDLREELQSAHHRLETATAEIHDLRSAAAKSTEAAEAARLELANKEREVEELAAERSALRVRLEEVTQSNAELDHLAKVAEGQLSEARDTIVSLTSERDTLRRIHEEREARLERVTQEAAEARAALVQIESRLADARRETEGVAARLRSMEDAFVSERDGFARSSRESALREEEMRREISTLRAQAGHVPGLRDALARAESHVTDYDLMQAELADARGLIESQRAKIEAQGTEVRRFREAATRYEAEAAALNEANADLQHTVTEIERRLTAASARAEEREATISGLRGELREKQRVAEEVGALRSDLAAALAEVRDLREDHSRVLREKEAALAAHAETSRDAARLQEIIRDLERASARAQAEHETLERAHKEQTRVLTETREEASQLGIRLSEAESSIEAIEANRKQLRLELDAATRARDEQADQVHELRAEISVAQEQAQALRLRLQAAEEVTAERDSLARRLETAEERVAEVTATSSTRERELQERHAGEVEKLRAATRSQTERAQALEVRLDEAERALHTAELAVADRASLEERLARSEADFRDLSAASTAKDIRNADKIHALRQRLAHESALARQAGELRSRLDAAMERSAHLESLETTLASVRRENEALQMGKEALSLALEEKTQAHGEVKATMRDLQRSLEEKSSLSAQVPILQGRLEEAEAELADSRAAVEAHTVEKRRLESKKPALLAKAEEVRRARAQELGALRGERDGLADRVAELEAADLERQRAFESAKGQLLDQAGSLRARLVELEAQMKVEGAAAQDALASERREHQDALKKVLATNDRIATENGALIQRAEALQRELERSSATIADYEARMAALETKASRVEALVEEADAREHVVSGLESRVEELANAEDEKAATAKEYEALRDAHERETSRAAALDEEVANLRWQIRSQAEEYKQRVELIWHEAALSTESRLYSRMRERMEALNALLTEVVEFPFDADSPWSVEDHLAEPHPFDSEYATFDTAIQRLVAQYKEIRVKEEQARTAIVAAERRASEAEDEVFTHKGAEFSMMHERDAAREELERLRSAMDALHLDHQLNLQAQKAELEYVHAQAMARKEEELADVNHRLAKAKTLLRGVTTEVNATASGPVEAIRNLKEKLAEVEAARDALTSAATEQRERFEALAVEADHLRAAQVRFEQAAREHDSALQAKSLLVGQLCSILETDEEHAVAKAEELQAELVRLREVQAEREATDASLAAAGFVSGDTQSRIAGLLRRNAHLEKEWTRVRADWLERGIQMERIGEEKTAQQARADKLQKEALEITRIIRRGGERTPSRDTEADSLDHRVLAFVVKLEEAAKAREAAELERYTELQRHVLEIEAAASELRAEKGTSEDRNRELEAAVSELEQLRDRLVAETCSARELVDSERAEHKHIVEELRRSIGTLESDTRDLEEALAQLTAKMEAIVSATSAMYTALGDREARDQDPVQALKQGALQIAALEEQLRTNEDALARVRSENADLLEENKRIRARLDELEEEASRASEVLSGSGRGHAGGNSLADRIGEIQEERDELKRRLTAQEIEVAQMAIDHGLAEEELQREIREKDGENVQIAQRIAELEDELDRQATEFGRQQGELSEHVDTAVARAATLTGKLEQEQERHLKEEEALSERLSASRSEADRLRASIEQLAATNRSELEAAEKAASDADERSAKLSAELTRLRDVHAREMHAAREAMDRAADEASHATEQLRLARGTFEDGQSRLSYSVIELTRLRDQLENELAYLREDLAEIHTAVPAMRAALHFRNEITPSLALTQGAARIVELEAKLGHANSTVERVQAQMRDAAEEVTAVQAHMEEQRALTEELTHDNEALRARVALLEHTIERKNLRIAFLTWRAQAAEDKAAGYQEAIARAEAAEAEAKDLRGRVDTLEGTLRHQVGLLEEQDARIAALAQENDLLSDEVRRARAPVADGEIAALFGEGDLESLEELGAIAARAQEDITAAGDAAKELVLPRSRGVYEHAQVVRRLTRPGAVEAYVRSPEEGPGILIRENLDVDGKKVLFKGVRGHRRSIQDRNLQELFNLVHTKADKSYAYMKALAPELVKRCVALARELRAHQERIGDAPTNLRLLARTRLAQREELARLTEGVETARAAEEANQARINEISRLLAERNPSLKPTKSTRKQLVAEQKAKEENRVVLKDGIASAIETYNREYSRYEETLQSTYAIHPLFPILQYCYKLVPTQGRGAGTSVVDQGSSNLAVMVLRFRLLIDYQLTKDMEVATRYNYEQLLAVFVRIENALSTMFAAVEPVEQDIDPICS